MLCNVSLQHCVVFASTKACETLGCSTTEFVRWTLCCKKRAWRGCYRVFGITLSLYSHVQFFVFPAYGYKLWSVTIDLVYDDCCDVTWNACWSKWDGLLIKCFSLSRCQHDTSLHLEELMTISLPSWFRSLFCVLCPLPDDWIEGPPDTFVQPAH